MEMVVNAPMARDKIVSLLTGYRVSGVEFNFIKSEGMKLVFEVANLGSEAAVNLAKALIRDTDFGKVLYFSIDII